MCPFCFCRRAADFSSGGEDIPVSSGNRLSGMAKSCTQECWKRSSRALEFHVLDHPGQPRADARVFATGLNIDKPSGSCFPAAARAASHGTLPATRRMQEMVSLHSAERAASTRRASGTAPHTGRRFPRFCLTSC